METLILLGVLLMPVKGPITQFPTSKHPAIDIACAPGDPVVASHGGQLMTSYDVYMGNVAQVIGADFESTYAHLDTVTAQRLVIAGEQVGTCGNTGRLTTGPHLHFSVERTR
jgi:murein DD-endopeptidase MepM/ murein hydrolase activator NlpD